MSTESKRAWREAEFERYAEYKRIRAQARRDRYWDRWEALAAGRAPRECVSSGSYYRYQNSNEVIPVQAEQQDQEKLSDSSICEAPQSGGLGVSPRRR